MFETHRIVCARGGRTADIAALYCVQPQVNHFHVYAERLNVFPQLQDPLFSQIWQLLDLRQIMQLICMFIGVMPSHPHVVMQYKVQFTMNPQLTIRAV